MDHLLGQSAAVFASLLWTFTSLVFAASARRIGALALNAWRITFAVGLLGLTHLLLFGDLAPAASGGGGATEAGQAEIGWLALSGVIGLTVGDLAYFACLAYIGARRGVLLMGQAPIFTLAGAYLVLGELPGAWALLGVTVTLAGVFVVLADQPQGGGGGEAKGEGRSRKGMAWGVTLGFIAAFGQGFGLVVTGLGNEGVNPLSVSLVRMVAACVAVWVTVLLTRRLPEVLAALRQREGMAYAAAGAVIGPFLGVWAIMVAIANTYTGVAATLSSLAPVMIIPVLWVAYNQRTGLRGILGALVSIVGVAIIFLV